MMINNEFKASFPIETVEDWVRQSGIEDGAILEHQTVSISEINFNQTTGYLEVTGDLWKKEDA